MAKWQNGKIAKWPKYHERKKLKKTGKKLLKFSKA
jgi:hypothetical protein